MGHLDLLGALVGVGPVATVASGGLCSRAVSDPASLDESIAASSSRDGETSDSVPLPITAAAFSVLAPKSIFRKRAMLVFLCPTKSAR